MQLCGHRAWWSLTRSVCSTFIQIENVFVYVLQVSVLNHLQDLHHHFFAVAHINGLEHLAVLPPAQLPHQLIVLLIAVSKRIEMVKQQDQRIA